VASAITYQSGSRRSDLRTVIAEDVQRAVVLLPSGRLEVLTAKLLHGTTCAHRFWADELGLDADDDTFSCPAEMVRAVRDIKIAAKARKDHK
jgi:hypothetical protein